MFMKKMFIALKENIMLETITEELRYCKGNKKKIPHKKVDGIMKKTRRGYKQWLRTDTGDYLKKKKIKESTLEIKENKQKLREYERNQIRVVPQEELQQRIEHITEQVNKSLKRLIS